MIKRSSFVILMAAVFAAGCTDDSNIPAPIPPADGTETPPATTTVQIVHAVSDAPTVNASVGTNTGGLSSIDFKESRTARSYPVGEYTVSFTVDQPGDADPAEGLIPSATVAGAVDTNYTVIAIGDADGGEDLDTLTFTRSGSIPSGVSRVTLLHAATNAPAVNVFVTEYDAVTDECADIDPASPANSAPLSYGESETGVADVPEGVWCVQVATADGDNVVFNTGPITFNGGTDPIFAAVNNTNDGIILDGEAGSPISILAIGRLQHNDVLDFQTTSEVRVVHTISDLANPVDVVIDGTAALENLDFGDVQPDPQLPGGLGIFFPADDYLIQINSAGTSTCLINCTVENPDGTTDEPVETTLDAGVFYDAIAQGLATTIEEGATEPDPAAALVYETGDRRRVAGFTKIRAIHSAGTVGDVDVYITGDTSGDPDLELGFGDSSGFVGLAPGDYTIVVTAAGSTDAVRTVPAQTYADGGIYTVIVTDGDVDAILLDDYTEIPQ